MCSITQILFVLCAVLLLLLVVVVVFYNCEYPV